MAHSEATRTQVFDALHERMSLRGVQRVFGVHRNTVIHWIKKSQPAKDTPNGRWERFATLR